MDGEREGPARRAVDAVTGALPGSLVRWATRRGAPMARISGRTAVGTAALRQTLIMLSRPPTRLRLRKGTADLDDIADRLGRDPEEVRRWDEAGLLPRQGEAEAEQTGHAVLDRAVLIDLALDAGADEAALVRAAAEDNVVLVALESVLTSRGEMTGAQAAERSEVPPQVLESVWQALGLPPGELAAPAFDRRDIHALRTMGALHAVFSEEDLTEAASVVGRAMTEVSTAMTDLFRRRIAEPFLAAGGTEADIVLRVAALRDLLVPTLAPLLGVALRRHLEAAIRSEVSVAMEQLIEPGSEQRVMAVAFADLVGFTEVSEQLSAADVRRLASTLFRIAEPAVSAHGGRVVKSIGDAVMFVAGDPVQCALAGVEIVEAVAADPDLPPVRAGLAYGPVLPGYADYFGSTVNLASRLSEAAVGGEVLFHAAEGAIGDAGWTQAGLRLEPRGVGELKGIGAVSAQAVRRRADARESGDDIVEKD